MNNIRDLDYLVEEITQGIKDLSCYKDYIFFRTNLENHAQLKEKVDRFKALQTEVYLDKSIHGGTDFNKESELNRIYSDIMISEEGVGFLNSEKEVKRQIAAIIENIVKGTNVDTEL